MESGVFNSTKITTFAAKLLCCPKLGIIAVGSGYLCGKETLHRLFWRYPALSCPNLN